MQNVYAKKEKEKAQRVGHMRKVTHTLSSRSAAAVQNGAAAALSIVFLVSFLFIFIVIGPRAHAWHRIERGGSVVSLVIDPVFVTLSYLPPPTPEGLFFRWLFLFMVLLYLDSAAPKPRLCWPFGTGILSSVFYCGASESE